MHIIVGLGIVLLLMAIFANRKTRACRWREDRRTDPVTWRCAFCGAQTPGKAGRPPDHCLRSPGDGAA